MAAAASIDCCHLRFERRVLKPGREAVRAGEARICSQLFCAGGQKGGNEGMEEKKALRSGHSESAPIHA